MASKNPTESSARDVYVPFGLRLSAAYVWRIGLVAVGVFYAFKVLGFFDTLVVPFLVAMLLCALLNPLVERLTGWMPRGLAVMLAVLLALGVISGLVTLVGNQVAGQMGQLTTQAMQGVEKIQDWLANGPLHLGNDQLTAYIQELTDRVQANSAEIAQSALRATSTAGEVVTGFVLALFTLIFLLLDGRHIASWMLRIVPRPGRAKAEVAARAGWISLGSYVRATIMVAMVDAIGIGVGAALLGVPLAVPLGVLVFLGAFIPIVGAVVSGSVAVLVALLTLGFVKALIMLAIVLGVQQLESHILQPFLMGRMVSLHPLGIVFAIGAGILVDGIVGALFSVPLVAVINSMAHALASSDDDEAAAAAVHEVDSPDGDDSSIDGRQGEPTLTSHHTTPAENRESAPTKGDD
ncbi:MAG: AI-2E family transporter [Actinomycetales bacterium]